jgi:hypothetical protein
MLYGVETELQMIIQYQKVFTVFLLWIPKLFKT